MMSASLLNLSPGANLRINSGAAGVRPRLKALIHVTGPSLAQW